MTLRVLGRNLSEVAVVGINVQSATSYAAPVRVVEPVEHLEPERGELFLRSVKVLEQPDVPVLKTGLVKDVSTPLVRESSLSRLQDVDAFLECVILPARPKLTRLRNIAVDQPARRESIIGITRIAAAGTYAGEVITGLHRNGRARLELRDLAKLPIAKQPAHNRLAVFEERQLIDYVDDRDVPVIEVRVTVLEAAIERIWQNRWVQKFAK